MTKDAASRAEVCRLLSCLEAIVDEAEYDYRPGDDKEISMIFVLGSIDQAAKERELRILVIWEKVSYDQARWSRRFLLVPRGPGPFLNPLNRPWGEVNDDRAFDDGFRVLQHLPLQIRVLVRARELERIGEGLDDRRCHQLVWFRDARVEGERVGPLWKQLEESRRDRPAPE